MGKKHKHPEHENLERWLVSYADFITLLFATFVVLYALSQADLNKLKAVSDSIKAAFSSPARGIMNKQPGNLDGQANPKILPKSGTGIMDRVNPKPPGATPASSTTTTTTQGTVKPVAEAVKEINKEISKLTGAGKGKEGSGGEAGSATSAQLKLQERGIVISFSSNLFFEPGSAGIKPESYPVLDMVAKELHTMDRIIHVEGHTDNQPIITAVYPSNWELSTARASSVVRYFVKKHQVPAAHLAAVGYADTRPLVENTTAAGRAKNRRVDIVILFTAAVEEADAGAAQKTETNVVLSEETDSPGVHKVLVPLKSKPSALPSKPALPHKVVVEDSSSGGKSSINLPKKPSAMPAPTAHKAVREASSGEGTITHH